MRKISTRPAQFPIGSIVAGKTASRKELPTFKVTANVTHWDITVCLKSLHEFARFRRNSKQMPNSSLKSSTQSKTNIILLNDINNICTKYENSSPI